MRTQVLGCSQRCMNSPSSSPDAQRGRDQRGTCFRVLFIAEPTPTSPGDRKRLTLNQQHTSPFSPGTPSPIFSPSFTLCAGLVLPLAIASLSAGGIWRRGRPQQHRRAGLQKRVLLARGTIVKGERSQHEPQGVLRVNSSSKETPQTKHFSWVGVSSCGSWGMMARDGRATEESSHRPRGVSINSQHLACLKGFRVCDVSGSVHP